MYLEVMRRWWQKYTIRSRCGRQRDPRESYNQGKLAITTRRAKDGTDIPEITLYEASNSSPKRAIQTSIVCIK